MRISMTSVMVDDQEKALRFYTEKLGFAKKVDMPVSEEHRWLTVVSADAPDGTQLLLEPNGMEASQVFQAAMYEAGVPLMAFQVDDCAAEHERLAAAGVSFKTEPKDVGTAVIAVFDDTCGNYIQIYQEK